MVKKLQKISADQKSHKAGSPLSSAVKDSAQQIWLAGLGAFSKAQEEGSKVFDTLVKEGMAIQRKTQAVAEGKITEATSRMSDMASDIQSKAGNRWDKLENIFEDRVAKALTQLGVPSARDVGALAERIDQLEQQIQKMNSAAAAPRPAARTAAKAKASPAVGAPAAKAPARPAAKRAAKKPASAPADSSAAE